MKNALLTISAALLTCSGMLAATASPVTAFGELTNCGPVSVPATAQTSTRASGSVSFTWAGEVKTAYGFNGIPAGYELYQAFQVSPSIVAAMAGNKVSEITLTTGINTQYNKNPNFNVTLFLTTDLTADPFYSQAVKTSNKAFSTETFALTEPQEFDATKPLYVGYRFTSNTLTQYPFVVDGVALDAPASYVAIMESTNSQPGEADWTNYASEWGALCIGCTFSGDNFTDIMVSPKGITCPSLSSLNLTPVYGLSVLNMGADAVTSMTVHVEATGEEAYDVEYTPATEIAKGASATMEITGKNYTVTGEKEIKLSVTKVNGSDNPSADAVVTAKTVVVDELYPRIGLFEVGTGTWCGWCPRSLVALEYIHEKYEGKVIGIAYHNGDAMANVYSNTWVNYMNPPGFPYAVFNRIEEGAEPANNSYKAMDDQFNPCIQSGSLCQAEVADFTPNEGGNTGVVTAKYRFAADVSSENYLVSVVLLEDNVGPYKQNNSYASGQGGALFGWEKDGSQVVYTYNDVCRFLSNCPGTPITSDPTTLTKGQDYDVQFNVNLAQIKSKDADPAFRAVVMVVDKTTGEVLNAAEKSFRKSAVQGIMSDVAKPEIVLGEGSINISNAANVAIYTLDGVKVANGSASGLAKGIYIVKADNLVQKVLVK